MKFWYLGIFWIGLFACSLKKDLKEVRELSEPLMEKIEQSYFKYTGKVGYFVDKESFSAYVTNDNIFALTLPGKKNLYEADVAEGGATVGYVVVINNSKKGAAVDDGFYLVKLTDLANLDGTTRASLYTEQKAEAGAISVTVTHMPEFDEYDPQGMCEDKNGGKCSAFYIDFEYYCVCLYPSVATPSNPASL